MGLLLNTCLFVTICSPGLFALSLAQKLPSSLVSVGDLKIEIFEQEPRVLATVDVTTPLGESSVTVKATLKGESDVRLRETYESAEVMVRRVLVCFCHLQSKVCKYGSESNNTILVTSSSF